MKRSTVLVVEDNSLNLWCILEHLKKLNVDVISATSGEQALELMENKSVDCMLLDINLGLGISGLDLMEKFRKQDKFKNIPIIAVSAYYGDGTHVSLIKKGFTDYLAKPYRLEQLEQIIKKYGIITQN
jgi:CheY-like chemotaxis protein